MHFYPSTSLLTPAFVALEVVGLWHETLMLRSICTSWALRLLVVPCASSPHAMLPVTVVGELAQVLVVYLLIRNQLPVCEQAWK